MSAVIDKPRVLLVEPSSTMRHVLKNYAEEAGYNVETHSAYADAAGALKDQFDTFDPDYGCLLLGWPPVRDRDSTRLLGLLEGVDYHDLPVVVLSQDMRADSRAWVAARDHSVMLRWKDYQSVGGLMEKLLDQSIFLANGDSTEKFSNSDINILVVDDSASIRYSLNDLFSVHGYRVTVVGSHDDAVAAAGSDTFDIALLDYYLQDSTGDDLCRALLEQDTSGELLCAILTGTYSDHIIKQSLQAGAVECMFKNESSDLLLARIDALSRVVRQRKLMEQHRRQTDTIIDRIGGSVFSFDAEGVITYANQSAMKNLGHGIDFTLLGQNVGDRVSAGLMPAATDSGPDIAKGKSTGLPVAGKRVRGIFSVADRPPIDVMYQCSPIGQGDADEGTIVMFRTREELAVAGITAEAANESISGAAIDPAGESVAGSPQDEEITLFLKTLSENIGHSGGNRELLTLLMLDVGFVDKHYSQQSITESDDIVTQLTATLKQVYPHDHHAAYLGDSRFGILLRHQTESQAVHLTRKIMQIINDVGTRTGEGEFNCTGALLSLNKNPALTEDQLLRRTRKGLVLVEKGGRNNALLIDRKRLLPVYREMMGTP